MTEMTALDAKNRFGRLLDLAQRGPVTITKNGRPSAVVMSADAYEARRTSARQRLRAALNRTRNEAARSGLTEDDLDALLANDS